MNSRPSCHPDRKYCAKGLCRQCYNALWYKANSDKVNKASKLWRASNRDKVRKSSRKSYALHLEKERKRARKTYLLDKGKSFTRTHRRRAAIRGSSSLGVTQERFIEKCAEADWRCSYCFKRCEKLTREHVIPISKGGKDEDSNVVPACIQCNLSKRDHLLEEWLW
jgi:5-methylcytosine-specific restriction endonuclease McrA